VIEIWHCDAEGFYSGVDNIVFDPATLLATDRALDMKDHTFLRGHQVTDERGRVEFTTIYPGWYMPRVAHIHVRLMWRDVEWTALDTQLFLPADVERAVYQTEPYAARGPNPIEIERDGVLKGNKDVLKDLMVQLEKDGDGFRGQFEFAVTTL
jgi:protocatechuate 3,4-dioxygenase beta subunit